MKQLVIPLVSAAILALPGCSARMPSEGSGKTVLEARIHDMGCMTLMDFQRTDGQKYEFGGVPFYRMEYTAKIRIDEGCYGAYGNEDHKLWRFPKKFHLEDDDANLKAMGYRLVGEGDILLITGNIDFEKHGKQWIGHEHLF